MAAKVGQGIGFSTSFLVTARHLCSTRSRHGSLLGNWVKGALTTSGLDTAGGGAENQLLQQSWVPSWCRYRGEGAAWGSNWSLLHLFSTAWLLLLGCRHGVCDVLEVSRGGAAQLVHEVLSEDRHLSSAIIVKANSGVPIEACYLFVSIYLT